VSVILIRKTVVRREPRQIVCETLSQKKKITKQGWWTDSRYSPEFNPLYHKKMKEF
jgi:hypothetical protein